MMEAPKICRLNCLGISSNRRSARANLEYYFNFIFITKGSLSFTKYTQTQKKSFENG